jgi:hypothetical protein
MLSLRTRLFLPLACAALLGALVPPPAHAGALGKALSREVAGRIAARQTLTSAERQALQRTLREMDTRTLAALEARYGAHIPREALLHAQQNPSVFLDDAAYQVWLKGAYPNAAPSELRGVIGDMHTATRRVTVNRNQATLVRNVAHERVHQLSHPRFGQRMGSDFDEGVTDFFAARVSSDMSLRDAAVGYPAQRELAGMLVARVGEGPVARAYFRGEFDLLARDLERALGPRAFTTFQGHLQRQDYAAARALLLGPKP